MMFPKIGTLEAEALNMLLKNGSAGVTCHDFPEHSPLHDDEKLSEIMENLKNGMFESVDDAIISFDA